MHAVVVSAVLMTLSAAGRVEAGASLGWRTVAVRVYSRTLVANLDETLAVAARHLQPAGVDADWIRCPASEQPGGEARCAGPMPDALVLRLVNGPAAASGGRVPLGDAYIDRSTGSGVLGTVYVDRVERLAALAHAPAREVLGRAIAHELGHLLMGTTTHSPRGLMRPVWTPAELRRQTASDWRFQGADIDAMRRAAMRRAATRLAATASRGAVRPRG